MLVTTWKDRELPHPLRLRAFPRKEEPLIVNKRKNSSEDVYRQKPEFSVVVIDFASYLFRVYLEYNREKRESDRTQDFDNAVVKP